jgi:hypothetical protein
MKKLWAFLVIFIGGFTLQAQKNNEEIRQIYDSSAIFQFSESGFSLNGKPLKSKQLKALLLSYPESATEYKSFRKKRRLATIFLVTGSVAYLSSFFILPQNPELALGTLGLSGVGVLGSLPYAIKSRRHLQKAVWIYNRSILTGEKKIAMR